MLACLAASAQETLPVQFLSETVAGPDRYAGTDAFGWEYTLHNNEFRKSKDGRVLKYKALQLGEIERADLQNPLQIVLFYRKFNTVVLLDNQLNETARINFSDIPQQRRQQPQQQPIIAEAAGLASQNRLWLYDVNTQQIGLYDLSGHSFKAIMPPFNKPIKDYYSDYNYFYWVDADNNFFMVSLFGKVSSPGSVPPYEQIRIVSGKQLLLKTENGLYLFSTGSGSLVKIDIVEKSFDSFYYNGQILSIFTGTNITNYKITL